MDIKAIRGLSGLSQKGFAEKYNIPIKTIQHWEIGERKPPEYLLQLLERCVREDKSSKS